MNFDMENNFLLTGRSKGKENRRIYPLLFFLIDKNRPTSLYLLRYNLVFLSVTNFSFLKLYIFAFKNELKIALQEKLLGKERDFQKLKFN